VISSEFSTEIILVSEGKLARKYVGIKCQLDATDEFLLQILLLAQHVSAAGCCF
jgi:hypothetical protein